MTEKICAVDLGMPTLLEAAGAEESAALCRGRWGCNSWN